jgi:hypothetical protein
MPKQSRDSENFFQRNVFRKRESSADSNLCDESVWFLFGARQPMDAYRNEVFDWTGCEKSDFARVLSAEHAELDADKDDYLQRDRYYEFASLSGEDVLHRLFLQLASTWKYETRFASSVTDIVLNSNYLQIIGIGPSAIPFILKNLENEPNHWFHALRAISRENPIRSEDRGNIKAMMGAWLSWGKAQGII